MKIIISAAASGRARGAAPPAPRTLREIVSPATEVARSIRTSTDEMRMS
jgi:hypothetical protein